jgi:hypothetical protein
LNIREDWRGLADYISTLRDTVGELGKRGKMGGGGWHVFENTKPLADAGRNGTDREDVVARE